MAPYVGMRSVTARQARALLESGMEDEMDKDSVCGRTISRGQAAENAEYQGKTYYFCSPECRARFDKDPLQYAVRRISEAAPSGTPSGPR